MIVVLDNGHGNNTAGKCSPDKILREWKYTRDIARDLNKKLKEAGIQSHLLVEEVWDVSLAERVKRINTICKEFGAKNVILISIHLNAAGDGRQWMNAHGWEAYTTRGTTNSDKLATCLYEAAREHFGQDEVREDWSDGDADKEAGFYILKGSNCPAVLTENFFMDNLKEKEWLMSLEGRQSIVNMHFDGIKKYLGL